jgi:hypothetical protein
VVAKQESRDVADGANCAAHPDLDFQSPVIGHA